MPSVKSIKAIPIWVWIPPIYTPIYKIEIIHGSTATDVTDIIHEGEYTDGVTETIGSFKFKIDNSGEDYTDAFSLYDKIRIYLDYSDEATTLKFEGIIERLSKTGSTIIVSGRGAAAKYTGTLITYTASAAEPSVILNAIITKYFSGTLTATNVAASTATVTVNWYEKPFWECVIELCNAASFDAYIDTSYDMHFFETGSVINPTEMVVHEYNLLETGDFSPDLTFVKNKVKVYGAEIDGVPIIATAEDSTSQTAYGLREESITDTNISTVTQAQNRADFELARKKDPPIIGEVTSLGLPTLSPGESLNISDPLNGLNPTSYQIQKFVHKFSNDEPFKTTITILKEISSLPKILKKRLSFEQEISSNPNPNEMEFSQVYDFNTATGGFTNCEVSQGFLKCTAGQITGTWISPTITATSTASYCEIRVKGNQIVGTEYYISSDNGINYNSVNPDVKINFTPPGISLRFKIILKAAATEIDTAALLYA